MARYSDKEKAKDKLAQEGYGQGPDTGYGEPPPPGYEAPPEDYAPPPPPEPEPTGSLRVKVVALDPVSHSPRKDTLLPRIDVTLQATSYGKVYQDTQTTDSNNEVFWPDLPLDAYTVSVEAPPEYEQPEDRKIELTEDHQDHEEEIGLTPKDAFLNLTAFLDEKRCGDPAGQKCLEGVDLDLSAGGQFLKTVRTNRDGIASARVPPGEILVKPRGSWTSRGRTWKAQDFQVFLDPGDEDTVDIPFVENLGTLLLSAVFVDETHGGREVPISGVKVLIYSGNVPKGVPFRDPILADRAPKSEGELDEGFYTLVPIGPESFRSVPIEPDEIDPIFVPGGETTEVVFRFHQARGRLTGFLLEQKSQGGFAGARLRLYPSDGGPWLSAETGEHGDFTFDDVPAGLHELVLEMDKLSKPDGTEWVLAADSPRSRKVIVKAGATEIVVPPLQLVEDDHVLVVRVVGPDGKTASGVQVDVRDEQGTLVGTFPVNDQGEVTIHVSRIGNYSVSLATFDSGILKPAAKHVFVNHPALITLEMTGSSWSFPPGGGGSQGDAVVDIPYPLLGAGFSVPSAPAGGAGTATTNLGASVENTLREVLGGWKPRGLKTDPKGFLGALNQAFTLKEVEGHVEFSWTPRTYAVQPDMGGLTGAQASIFNRAKVALDQSVPLLDGLYPLRADSDDQDVDAIRAIVRSTFTELVNELGVEGGPRVPRVDSLFEQLLGLAPVFDPERVGGQLGMIAQQFGLQRRRINTIDEEQNLTNFIIVVEYVLSLKTSWDTQRGFFTRSGLSEPFFGTQLVLVSRSLAVVAESVQEVYAAMDSVFLGPAERQVVELTFLNEPGRPSLFVAELLSWVDQIATVEGPRLIQDGGKAGVVAFQPTLDRVARLASQALIPPQDGAQLPAGYRTARVQRALQELADHLDETARLAGQIKIDKNAA